MDGCGASTLSARRQQNAIDTDTDDVAVVSQLPTKAGQGGSILIFLLVISKPLKPNSVWVSWKSNPVYNIN